MDEPTIMTELLPAFTPIPSFADIVEAFCIEQAEFRARLALAGGGDGEPRDDAISDRGAHRTPS